MLKSVESDLQPWLDSLNGLSRVVICPLYPLHPRYLLSKYAYLRGRVSVTAAEYVSSNKLSNGTKTFFSRPTVPECPLFCPAISAKTGGKRR